jgi:lambda family phage holin
MFEKEPGLLSMFSAAADWLKDHPYGSWGVITAFLTALWSGFKDKHGWLSSIFGGVLATIITLSILAVMKKTGLHEEWMPIVGLLVGFVGADRIRAAVLGAWETRKGNLVNTDESKK